MTATGAGANQTEQAEALRRRRLNVLGHELRTPIAMLSGLAERLADADLDEIRSEIGPAIHRLAARAERLLDDLLVASEVDTALPVDPAVPLDLAEVVQRAWTVLGEPCRLTCEGQASALAGAEAVERTVTHLLRNAATYGDGHVGVEISRSGDRAVVRVRNGGVEPGSLEVALVFEAFYRGEHAVTRAPGLGLGLAVARRLARHCGGEVTVEVEPDGDFVAELVLDAS